MTSVRSAPPHVVLYVGGTSEHSAAAIEEVNHFCDTLPGGFGIRVINVRSQTDCAALDGRLPASMLVDRDVLHSGRLTRRQRAARAARRTDSADAIAEGVGL